MKKTLFLLALCLTMFSCKTYLISPQSLKEQLESTNPEGAKQAKINNPLLGGTISYQANALSVVNVMSKDGNLVTLANSPSLETRVTLRNGKKYTVYFDTLMLQNGILFGSGAKLFKIAEREIPFDSIVKVEIQDGGKNYTYK
ncbi:hypothetical protein [Flavobacterium sp. BFFFF1]|uniref:hypothetical protein n=1 Tax=Flavobacterium sp. BFFFF1 TaxID=2015557 RepID=UPI0025C720B3|nr:hypothetical protein [Flavobacterium sp. BFFFF1]